MVGGLTPWTLPYALMYAIGGFIGHEVFHLAAYYLVGERAELDVGYGLLAIGFRPVGTIARWKSALILLAPLPWAVGGTWWLTSAGPSPIFAPPLNLGELVIVGAFLLGALPSIGDIYSLLFYDPAAASPEVAA